MKHLFLVMPVLILGLMVGMLNPAKADLVCPTGSLSALANPDAMWRAFASRNFDHLEQWHRRLSNGLLQVLEARGQNAKVQASRALGQDRTILMQRMFEEGLYAASDILNEKCRSDSKTRKPKDLTLTEELTKRKKKSRRGVSEIFRANENLLLATGLFGLAGLIFLLLRISDKPKKRPRIVPSLDPRRLP